MASEIILSIFFAALIALLITIPSRRKGPGPGSGFLFFFMITFLFIWAFSSWVTPAGPVFMGVAWLPFFFIGLIFLFIMLAVIPAEPRPPQGVTPEEADTEVVASAITFGCFFWLLLISLIAAIVVRYFILPVANV